MNLFYTMTQSNCDFENLILYWAEKFLESKFGAKYKNKLQVDPLVDTDGVFCYLKNPNFSLKWTNEVKYRGNVDDGCS